MRGLHTRFAFCRKMASILPQNGMRFAAKWNAFWGKMDFVLAQNGLRFGPKRSAFWPKMVFGCAAFCLTTPAVKAHSGHWQWVDPRIGSVGVGRTFPGPCVPFGMVKPGPDCGVLPNAGWAPMPAAVSGFSQTHVSGTGGGQKYGNILIQPFISSGQTRKDATTPTYSRFRLYDKDADLAQLRTDETISLGYYATTFESGIRTEITTSARCAHYRFHYPSLAGNALFVDATHFLGKDSIPNLRERQQFQGAQLHTVSNNEVRGYSSVSGGWNNGDTYTVYFALQSDRPFTAATDDKSQTARLLFTDSVVNVRVGISYVSEHQAAKNIDSIGFDACLSANREAWEQQLAKISIDGTEQQKRMFYTALYHTMLMPVDKSGENPRWTDTPYYDDYYAIWDTYRTSSPLITLLDPQREAAIVNALLNIYRHEDYMPDARSGDCNGRTQGGSNAEVVIADAFAKNIDGIDYSLALEAMLKDGEADPGADHEKHGRGGLTEYLRYGYIPYGTDRAGNRTIEYAYNDWCIAQVAKGLGRTDIYNRYKQRADNWRNLWRKDYASDGMRGFIMPRDADGQWLDSVPWGHSKVFKPTIPYTPTTKVAPWYLPWWATFFYEATSQEYSLSIPHDVPGLITACGGTEAFRNRLDRFFECNYYNVQNEPSFLTPCLYHWIGRPDLSTRRIHKIVNDNYTDRPDGLPGNDDSGAMSSWLAFHMMGLYPNAGQDYYLLNVPLLQAYTFTLSNGKKLHVSKSGSGNGYGRATLNGRELTKARITHAELMGGGELVFETTPDPIVIEAEQQDKQSDAISTHPELTTLQQPFISAEIYFTLNRQHRTWPLLFSWDDDTLNVMCKATTYRIARKTVDESTRFCWLTPQQDGTVYNHAAGTFAFISHSALHEALLKGVFTYDNITWRIVGRTADSIEVEADVDHTRMTISTKTPLPLVTEMNNNPLGIDWKINCYENK